MFYVGITKLPEQHQPNSNCPFRRFLLMTTVLLLMSATVPSTSGAEERGAIAEKNGVDNGTDQQQLLNLIDQSELIRGKNGSEEVQQKDNGQQRRKWWLSRGKMAHGGQCENNGTFVNGKCECRYPYVGPRCADFACEHGLSVGPRYDPESTFFNRRCICDEDWAGELCNVPIADQCNERGQYINGRCKCHGYYFGPKCQYVGKCVNGKLLEGVCVCSYGFEGDYCDKIVCHHGYSDKTKSAATCVCPPRHTGRFCDECVLVGPHILPFPNCTEEHVPYHARLSRERTDSLIYSRLIVLLVTMTLLAFAAGTMCILHWGHNRSDPARELTRRRIAEERKEMLTRAIFSPKEPAANGQLLPISGRRESRRSSIPVEWVGRLETF